MENREQLILEKQYDAVAFLISKSGETHGKVLEDIYKEHPVFIFFFFINYLGNRRHKNFEKIREEIQLIYRDYVDGKIDDQRFDFLSELYWVSLQNHIREDGYEEKLVDFKIKNIVAGEY